MGRVDPGVLIHYGDAKFSKRKFLPIRNAGWIKPTGGLWTSPVNSKHSWKSWCKGADFRDCKKEPFFKLRLKEDSRIYIVETPEDIKRLPEYSDDSIRTLIQSIARPAFFAHTPDFEAISKSYDAIWLTAKGERNTRFSSPSFYGWDCETVLILNKKAIDLSSLSLAGSST